MALYAYEPLLTTDGTRPVPRAVVGFYADTDTEFKTPLEVFTLEGKSLGFSPVADAHGYINNAGGYMLPVQYGKSKSGTLPAVPVFSVRSIIEDSNKAVVAAERAAQAAEDAAAGSGGGTVEAGTDTSVPFAGIVPGNFTKWRAALARVRSGVGDAKVLCVGDSTTWGVGSGAANTPDGSYPAHLAKLMNSYLVPASPGLAVPTSYFAADVTDSRWKLGTGWREGALGWGNGATYSAPSGTTTALTFTPGINCDTMDVYYLTAESGRVNLSIDGGPATQTAAPVGQGIDKTTITTTPGANHVLTINGVTGGTAHIVGVEAYLSTSRVVRVGNAGVPGSTSTTWKGDYPSINFSAPSCIAKYTPDLTIIMLGINDAAAKYPVATVAANLQALITAAKTTGNVILASVVPSGPGFGPSIVANEEAYRLAQIDLAKSNNVGFVDVFSRFGSWSTASTAGLMAADTNTADLHPGPAGYADIAAAMFAAIRAIG